MLTAYSNYYSHEHIININKKKKLWKTHKHDQLAQLFQG